MKSILVLVALLGMAFAFTTQEYEQEFTNWMQEHSKVYTHDEFHSRFNAFKWNMDYVRDWNNQNSQTVLGMTVFADMTNEEYRKIYLGTHVHTNVPAVESFPLVGLPDNVDWRTQGAVTPIKDQGQCGSCWAFSAVGSTEAAHFFAAKNLVSLSEQNLVDCSTAEGNGGCNGGLMDNAFKYIIKNKGIDTEASYPYKAVQKKCEFKAENVGATITNYTDVLPRGSESALQQAVVLTPVSVAIDASHNSFQLYKSGVYNEPQCSSSQLDHGVLAVGYGTESTTNTAYWIVKNSWGTSWGMNGYIEMSRNKNNQCGIATAASYPSA